MILLVYVAYYKNSIELDFVSDMSGENMNYNEKISELLGILNSINYDEIINNLEIEALKEWIKGNFNNNDPRFQEIIKKLNKVLYENKITETEKLKIINLTEQYYNLGLKLNNIAELVGIAEGIISDNVVNLKEVEKLKKWMLKNRHLVGTFFYDKLDNLLETILNDSILDDNELQQLYTLLTFLINDNLLNQRILVLKNMVKEKEIIGNQLIELIDDNTIINKIHKQAMDQIKVLVSKNCSVYAIDCEIIFISLTIIGLLNYDSKFWEHVRFEFKTLYDEFNEQKVDGQIRNVISKYKNDDDPRIISYVLKNTIVPKPFLPSFFEFIYDIYRLNFNYTIDPNIDLKEEFLFVYEGIKKGLNCEADELNLVVTNKTYRLIKTTKELILDETRIDSLIDLSTTILKIIDGYYWSTNYKEVDNEYFSYGFKNWVTNCEKNIKDSKSGASKFRSRWEPEFKLKENKIYLSIPNHKIKDCYDYESLKIELFNGNEKIYEKDKPDVYNIIGGYRIEQKDDIRIESPLDNLRYVLSCNGEIIYDSKEKLFRNYIFFYDSGYELENNKDYDGVTFLCSKSEQSGFDKLANTDKYVISYKQVKPGDYLKVGGEIFNFSTILKPGIIGIEKTSKIILNGLEQAIYEDVEGIVYETEKSIQNIVLKVNGERHHLSEYEFEEKNRGIYYNYFIKLELNNNIYQVDIEELENNSYIVKKRFNFALDKNFNFEIEQSSIDEYIETINFLDKKYTMAINYDMDDINTLSFNEKNIAFITPNGLPIYKLDSSRWMDINNLNNYIWLNDIASYSKLRINGISITSVQIKDEKGRLLSTLYPSIANTYYDLSVGTLRSYDSHNFIYLDFYNEDKKIGFLKVYCKCDINDNLTNIYFDKDDLKYHGIISFYGKGNIYVRVKDALGQLVYEQHIDNNEKFEINCLKAFENYKLEVIDKKTGFTLQETRVLYTKNLKYYSFDEFVGRYFQVYSVDYDQKICGVWENKTRVLYNTYIEILERIDSVEDIKFLGKLYTYKGKKEYLEKINPVEIVFEGDPNLNGQILAYITCEGEMLLNDFANHSILNDVEGNDYNVPIYSYVINMERNDKKWQE